MKARKVWECECGETKLYERVGTDDLIVKGDGYHVTEPFSKASQIITRCCSSKYVVNPPIVKANRPKKIWLCKCENTKLLQSESGEYLIQGSGFGYGSPTTHVVCYDCKDRYRIARNIVWYSHIQHKQSKRSNSKANRRAKRRRQKSF